MLAASLALYTALAATPDEIRPEPDEPLIYGGVEVNGEELAQVVAIEVGPNLCTGTVVSERVVLTAAHCFASQPDPSDVEVSIGSHVLSPLATVKAAKWAQHPDYCNNLEECPEDIHDFAYIVLEQPVSFDDGYAPPLATQDEFSDYMHDGREVLLVGFGEDEDKNKGQKRKVEVTIRRFSSEGGEFLAGGDGKDSCFGDSGGPALLELGDGELRLAGVLSRGFDCGEGGFYGIPYPVLCWLRSETGVDLANGCESCDCVDLPDDGLKDRNCGSCTLDRDGQDRHPVGPALLALGVVAVIRRRR